MTNVAVIKSGGANFTSITSCLERAGASFQVTTDPEVIQKASRVILPGVGSAQFGMEELNANGLATLIPNLKQPVLGVCLGMQLLGEYSQEGDTKCLGIMPIQTLKIRGKPGLIVPHMGWDNVLTKRHDPLFDGITSDDDFYFVHGYAMEIEDPYTLAVCDYGLPLTAAVHKNNFRGVQFHPEKSGSTGIKLIENFLRISS